MNKIHAHAALHERWLLILIAAIQFTVIVDFLIIMPLGPQYMRVFHILPSQFGLIVSAYAVSAGISGVAAGLFLDRIDRRPALIWLYFGFIVGTFLCALAPTYPLLVAARVVAGAFGGVAGALILAIVGDVVPEERRGAAMGVVMSSFSVASICGVPIGLMLASRLSWHVPFFGLAFLSALVWIAVLKILPSLRGHLKHVSEEHTIKRMLTVLLHPDHRMAFLFMAVMTTTGFLIFPYISNYMVANVGFTEKQLPLIYLAGGSFTIFSMNLIGRWADRAGKRLVFDWVSAIAVVAILGLTHLPRVPLVPAIAVTSFFMICMSGRMVPAMALMVGSIEPRYRGGFMSLNASVQQFSSGIAAYLGGRIMLQAPTGEILRFNWIGYLSVAGALGCIYLVRFLKPSQAGGTVADLY